MRGHPDDRRTPNRGSNLHEPDVRTEVVDYTAGDVTLKGYLAYDADADAQSWEAMQNFFKTIF